MDKAGRFVQEESGEALSSVSLPPPGCGLCTLTFTNLQSSLLTARVDEGN